ncbi:hypothetical protein AEAC466_09305 [Asticcacaulis sp. AC466]|uniref:hypothetical protein n=1 Tax=Asticcacaulis sp. AC466 TaxID=1282362 RepID=UPI0003C3FF5F|nr:hypothetical protein [Asticcacaulis sp. AC466]ESQ84539.1 hypothetical protein AEAC466_09305 [Asticcacaulis sp. AC466]
MSSLLTSYYDAKDGITPSDGTSATGTANAGVTDTSTKTTSPTGSGDAPVAPWSGASTAPQESDLVSAVMQGQNFINPNQMTSDVVGSSPDYTKLFTLYQGLNALEGIATAAASKTVSPNQLALYQSRFTAGMSEVETYLSGTKYDHVNLTEGTLTQDLQNSVGAARTNSTYVAQNIHQGSTSDAVKAFEGNVQFSVSVKRTGTATPIAVNFDLSEMGTQTRSMSNVTAYLNGKLKAAGLDTRFAIHTTPAVPETETVGGNTVTISPGQPSYGLQINGASFETMTFSAQDTADSVYVAQSTGDPTKTPTATSTSATASTTSSATPTATTDVTSQLLKFQTDISNTSGTPADPVSKIGDTYYVAGESEQTNLPSSVANVTLGDTKSTNAITQNALATAAGPDGSVYVLANVDATTSGQTIKGTQDVALMKYDSAGKIVYTRTLGASDSASGYALSVSADGKVAVAGSVTGALNINNPTTKTNAIGLPVSTGVAASTSALSGQSPTTTDSFVTVFDANGNEQWTQRRGATAADQATSVAFGADGSVYVGGKTQSTMPGASGSDGGWDGYVMGFSAQGKSLFTRQTGTPQTDQTAQLAVNGTTLYVASMQNNAAVLSSYDISSGKAVLTDTRNLGGIGGGNISGISVYDGKVYLGGSSGSPDLLKTGTVTSTYSGGFDAFALSVDANLTNTGQDKVAFYGGTGTEKNAQVQFMDGKAWISGQTNGAIAGTTKIGSEDAYLARLNVDTGQVEYQTRYSGADGQVAPNAIAVSQNSSSALDKLGLPLGTVQQTDSNTIVSNSSTRAGDMFYMVDPNSGAKKTITISADDTMASLATKIERASGYQLTVTVQKVLGKQQDQLDIKPADGSSSMEFVSGPAGKDALKGLGLPAGLVSNAAGQTMDPTSSNYLTSQKEMGLSFDSSLNLNSTQNIANAIKSLQATMSNVQKVYSYLKYGDPQPSKTTTSGSGAGVAPAYLTAQIANYQAGLQRLLGGG